MKKGVVLAEHLLVLVLVSSFVCSNVRRHFLLQRIRLGESQNNANAYFSEVSFWGNDSFYTKAIPVETNEFCDVELKLNKAVVYTSDVYANQQCRVVFEIKPDHTDASMYEASVVVYDFKTGNPIPKSGRTTDPFRFQLGANGVIPPGYKRFYGRSLSSADKSVFDVYFSMAKEQKRGSCVLYAYVGRPSSPFTREDGVAFLESPETVSRNKLYGKLIRFVWNYEDENIGL